MQSTSATLQPSPLASTRLTSRPGASLLHEPGVGSNSTAIFAKSSSAPKIYKSIPRLKEAAFHRIASSHQSVSGSSDYHQED